MKRITLLSKAEGALLIFENRSQQPPSVELSDADVQKLLELCQEYLAWRRENSGTEIAHEQARAQDSLHSAPSAIHTTSE